MHAYNFRIDNEAKVYKMWTIRKILTIVNFFGRLNEMIQAIYTSINIHLNINKTSFLYLHYVNLQTYQTYIKSHFEQTFQLWFAWAALRRDWIIGIKIRLQIIWIMSLYQLEIYTLW